MIGQGSLYSKLLVAFDLLTDEKVRTLVSDV